VTALSTSGPALNCSPAATFALCATAAKEAGH